MRRQTSLPHPARSPPVVTAQGTAAPCPAAAQPLPEAPRIAPARIFAKRKNTDLSTSLTSVVERLQVLRGLGPLYEWQRDCLCMYEKRAPGRNLLYAAPTSGGKTLVAEALALQALEAGRDVIFVLPFVSIVEEKVAGFQQLTGREGGFDIVVENYSGGKGKIPAVVRRTPSIRLCTIEKGAMLVNSLLEDTDTALLRKLGLIIIDEAHMIGTPDRGIWLEELITKVLFAQARVEVVAMSATISNICECGQFLNADVFVGEYRPVELSEMVKIGNRLFSIESIRKRLFRPMRVLSGSSEDEHVRDLVCEVAPAHSCLVFCPTRQACEITAAMLGRSLVAGDAQLQARRNALLDELFMMAGSRQPSIRGGVAFHHAGLTQEERALLEEAYDQNVLSVLTCTATLAAGVNLPARRVIIRSPKIAKEYLRPSQYQQMSGRAGRAGHCAVGESILCVPKEEGDLAQVLEKVLTGAPEACRSVLLGATGELPLRLILSLVASGLAITILQMEAFLAKTLLVLQQGAASIAGKALAALCALQSRGLVNISSETTANGVLNTNLVATELGRSTYKSNLDIDLALTLDRELTKAIQALVLTSDLHLVFLLTSFQLSNTIRIVWPRFLNVIAALAPNDLVVLNHLGISEAFVARKVQNSGGKTALDHVAVRIYAALMVNCVVNKSEALHDVANRFEVDRGFLQSLLQSSGNFASGVVNFTRERPSLWALTHLFEALVKRLAFGVPRELVALIEIPGVKYVRAKQLYQQGFTTLKALAMADPADLARNIPHLNSTLAGVIVCECKRMLRAKAAEMRDEALNLIEGVSVSTPGCEPPLTGVVNRFWGPAL